MEKCTAELVSERFEKYGYCTLTVSEIMSMSFIMKDGNYDVYGIEKNGITYFVWISNNRIQNIRIQKVDWW